MTHAEQNAKAALRKSMELNGDMMRTDRNRRILMEQRAINALASIIILLLGWWAVTIWANQQEMQKQVTTLTIELARNYVPRVELQANFDRINNTLERIDKQTRGPQR